MEKVLVSSCLLGNRVRYNGRDLPCSNDVLKKWLQEGRIVSVCPEVSAGLPIPRAPAEIKNGNGESVLKHDAIVIENTGEDVSQAFISGAKIALKLCQENNIKVAVLTESSPSCGSSKIYNGDFSNTKIAGFGVTSALLMENGIQVFSQHNFTEAAEFLSKIQATRS
ncbi:DUF523 domain-containing protein [Endozoicomonas sp. ALC020]|uniref:DUF523 domain-containing protein n=1 Tax=unclassified Endozoicomonas TaxID=2644528 RepID=UPI003BB0BCAC